MDQHNQEREIEEVEEYDHGSGMQMYFHFGLSEGQFLFSNLSLDTRLKFISACAILFSLAVLLEAIHYLCYIRCRCEINQLLPRCFQLQAHSDTGAICSRRKYQSVEENDGEILARRPEEMICCNGPSKCTHKAHLTPGLSGEQFYHCDRALFRPQSRARQLGQAGLQFVRGLIGTLLMLSAMTYNVCLIFSVLAGSSIGAYLFAKPAGQQRSSSHSACP